ncbi:hypothetical protein DFP74_2334 [Nocardiopsis sp. Huas11]|uniref:hypothetical protein n=1 Tax=Nocardiopsis sp. Huas11 TaxID=2183912 RepID=UPI000F239A50|nr:hypothetical protein [Nocardiopsis sp. Huas11]RKS06691.1 hypothetical protein DFP74_2334 [Nocardiopsis sp. Huas11]
MTDRTANTVLEAMRRGAGVSDEGRDGNRSLFKGIDEERSAIQKRERELRAQNVPNAAQVARKEFADAHAKRYADERKKSLRTAMDAIHERESREARAKYWGERAEAPIVPSGEIPPGTPINEVKAPRDRVSEKLMAQLYHLKGSA